MTVAADDPRRPRPDERNTLREVTVQRREARRQRVDRRIVEVAAVRRDAYPAIGRLHGHGPARAEPRYSRDAVSDAYGLPRRRRLKLQIRTVHI